MEDLGGDRNNPVEEGNKAIDAFTSTVHLAIAAATKTHCDSITHATEETVVSIGRPRHQALLEGLATAVVDANQPIEKVIIAAMRCSTRSTIPYINELQSQLNAYREHIGQHAQKYLETVNRHIPNYLRDYLGPNLRFSTVYTNSAWLSMDLKYRARSFDLLSAENPAAPGTCVGPDETSASKLRDIRAQMSQQVDACEQDCIRLQHDISRVAEKVVSIGATRRGVAPYEKLAREWEQLAATRMMHHPGYAVLGAAEVTKKAVKTITDRVIAYAKEVAKVASIQDAANLVAQSIDACNSARYVEPGEELEIDTNFLALDTAVGHWKRTARHDIAEIADLVQQTSELVPGLDEAMTEITTLATTRLVEAERVAGSQLPSRSQCIDAAARRSQRLIDAIDADAAHLARLLDDSVQNTIRHTPATATASEKTFAMLAIVENATNLIRQAEAVATDESSINAVAGTVCALIERERAAVSVVDEHTAPINNIARRIDLLSKGVAAAIRRASSAPTGVNMGTFSVTHVDLAPRIGRFPVAKHDTLRVSVAAAAIGRAFASDGIHVAVDGVQRTLSQPVVTVQDVSVCFSNVMAAILRSVQF